MKLSNRQNDILRHLYPDAKLSENDFFTEFNIKISDKSVHELNSLKLICIDTSRLYSPALIDLTEQGRAYVEALLQEEKQGKKQYRHELVITLVGAVLGNADRIFIFISNLIKNLLNG